MSDGIVWVEGYRLEIANDGASKTVFSKCVPVEATAKVSLISLRIVCAALCQIDALVTRQMGNQCFRYMRGDTVFEAQDISKLFIKLSGPHRRTVADIEQLHSDPYTIRGTPDPAVEYESGTEFATCDKRIRLGAVTQDTAGRADSKTPNGA